jgi:hypothetical protein
MKPDSYGSGFFYARAVCIRVCNRLLPGLHSAVAISLRIISRDSASKQQGSDVDGDF